MRICGYGLHIDQTGGQPTTALTLCSTQSLRATFSGTLHNGQRRELPRLIFGVMGMVIVPEFQRSLPGFICD